MRPDLADRAKPVCLGARVWRSTLIEIHFLTAPGWKIDGVATLDAIRQQVSDDPGNDGPDRWLMISFTEDPDWAF